MSTEENLISVTQVNKEIGNYCEDLLERVTKGLSIYPPEMCEEGLNGTYFLRDEAGQLTAVFKPADEEGNSIHNPKRIESDPFDDKGILDGEGATREIAAYLIDRESHFSGVPRTTMVRVSHPLFNGQIKTGSIQEFIENDGASWDIGYSQFPNAEVQKIGILDLRIFNNDRHGGNMLMSRGENGLYQLTPIDHGFSLPSNLAHAWFDWLNWPQSKRPFSEEAKEYIGAIDIQRDIEILTPLHIRPECLRTMKISTMLLKKGCSYGLTLFDIGSIISRSIPEEPSQLENWYSNALKEMGLVDGQITNQNEEQNLLQILERIMEKELPRNNNSAVQIIRVN